MIALYFRMNIYIFLNFPQQQDSRRSRHIATSEVASRLIPRPEVDQSECSRSEINQSERLISGHSESGNPEMSYTDSCVTEQYRRQNHESSDHIEPSPASTEVASLSVGTQTPSYLLPMAQFVCDGRNGDHVTLTTDIELLISGRDDPPPPYSVELHRSTST